MNPYESPTRSTTKPTPRRSKRIFIIAGLLNVFGLMIGTPGFVYTLGDLSRIIAAGRRYATYDSEIFIFGFSVHPTTAQFITFAIVPGIFILSAIWVIREYAFRKRKKLEAD